MITKGIFGAPLKSASLCGSYNEYGLSVPDPVYRCFEEIIKRGIYLKKKNNNNLLRSKKISLLTRMI